MNPTRPDYPTMTHEEALKLIPIFEAVPTAEDVRIEFHDVSPSGLPATWVIKAEHTSCVCCRHLGGPAQLTCAYAIRSGVGFTHIPSALAFARRFTPKSKRR